MGRIPKLVKEKALKEHQMRQEAALNEVNERSDEVHARESSCSSLSDRSIENYDPNAMEIGKTSSILLTHLINSLEKKSGCLLIEKKSRKSYFAYKKTAYR
jgi:hypothetical protein